MEEREVVCSMCGEYFEVPCDDDSLGTAYGVCPYCGEFGDHEIVAQDD